MSEATVTAWVLLPTARECVQSALATTTSEAVAAWLREDREGGWERYAQGWLDKIHASPTKLAMAVKIGRAATAREIGCYLRQQAVLALIEAGK